MKETQNKHTQNAEKGRVVIEYLYPISDLPGEEERKIIAMPCSELKNKIARSICRCDNRLASCLHCLTQLCKDKQKEECERILSKEKDLDASYMDRAEAVLRSILEE